MKAIVDYGSFMDGKNRRIVYWKKVLENTLYLEQNIQVGCSILT